MDTLHSIGPVHALVPAQLPAPSPDAPQGSSSALLAAVGHGRSGALAILRQKLVPDVITNVPVPGACLHVSYAATVDGMVVLVQLLALQ